MDVSYALRLSDQFGMSVGLRYMRSDLRIQAVDPDASAANTFGADITGYYQSEVQAYSSFDGRWRMGFAIQNIGPKFKYDDGGQENFQPTNLRLGGGFDFILDTYNKVSVTAEVTKLLVPTPPIYGTEYEYENNDGIDGYQPAEDPSNPQPGEDVLGDQISGDNEVIYDGKDPDVGFLAGMIQSFGDAPGGFSEELKEFTYALSAEYMYQESFALRAGFFHESPEKGARQFMSLGAGFKFKVVNVDLSYFRSHSS